MYEIQIQQEDGTYQYVITHNATVVSVLYESTNDYCVYYPIDVVEQIAKRYCYSTFLEKV